MQSNINHSLYECCMVSSFFFLCLLLTAFFYWSGFFEDSGQQSSTTTSFPSIEIGDISFLQQQQQQQSKYFLRNNDDPMWFFNVMTYYLSSDILVLRYNFVVWNMKYFRVLAVLLMVKPSLYFQRSFGLNFSKFHILNKLVDVCRYYEVYVGFEKILSKGPLKM